MTLEEAKLLAYVAGTADSGCSACVESICKNLNECFPEFEWKIDDVFDYVSDGPFGYGLKVSVMAKP